MNLSRRFVFAAMLGAAAACGDRSAPAQPQSVPVSKAPSDLPLDTPTPKQVVVPKSPGAVTDIVEVASLVERYPGIGKLEEAQQQIAVGAMHLVPGPCTPCAEAGEHLARCAMRAPVPECENIAPLVGRAVSWAGAGRSLKAVMEGVHYPDVWAKLPVGVAGRVTVDLVLAENDPWAPDALRAKAALEGRYGDAIMVRVTDSQGPIAQAIGVKATPTWAVAGYRMRGAQSAPALGRLIDREIKGPK